MLEQVFPTGERFKLTRNEHRGLGMSVSAYIRREHLTRAFASRHELRKALGLGEVWTMQSDETRASSSFVDLLRRAGREIPPMFDEVTPPLPRHDFGLILSYDIVREKPWELEYRSETRHRITILRGLTFQAVLQRALDLDSERARSTAEALLNMYHSERPGTYLH